MFYIQLLKVFALAIALALLVSSCKSVREVSLFQTSSTLENNFPATRTHLENDNYIAAYRAILMEQNKYKPASLEEVVEVAKVRSQIAIIALNKALVQLRRSYYQGYLDSVTKSAFDANFVCEMEGLVRPEFLIRINLLLLRSRHELYYLERDPPEMWKSPKT